MNLDFVDLKNYHKRNILAIDLKCFYASVECIDRNLDPFNTPLVVCDTSRGEGTIILAVSPYLKSLGIPSRLRKYELPKIENCIFAMPRMSRYLQVSAKVIDIYLNYVSLDDLHIYSIDEAFLDVTNYLKRKNMSDIDYAKEIINKVKEKTGLTVCAGIGENMFLAKVAMDIGAKKKKELFDKWSIEDIPSKLWNLQPLSKMWGIGNNMERRLNMLGLYKVGDIANYDPFKLSKIFGIKGEELYLHANGYDFSTISKKVQTKSKSFSSGQTLFFDATSFQAINNLFTMSEEIAHRLYKNKMFASEFSFIFVSSKPNLPSYSASIKTKPIQTITEITSLLKERCKYCPDNLSIRGIYLVASSLVSEKEVQLDLFSDIEKEDKLRNLDKAIYKLKEEFGEKCIIKCSALVEKNTQLTRFEQIGGHRK